MTSIVHCIYNVCCSILPHLSRSRARSLPLYLSLSFLPVLHLFILYHSLSLSLSFFFSTHYLSLSIVTSKVIRSGIGPLLTCSCRHFLLKYVWPCESETCKYIYIYILREREKLGSQRNLQPVKIPKRRSATGYSKHVNPVYIYSETHERVGLP